MDHFERAKREEEAPLILAAHTQRLQVLVEEFAPSRWECLLGTETVGRCSCA